MKIFPIDKRCIMDIFAYEALRFTASGFALLYAAKKTEDELSYEWYTAQRVGQVLRALAFTVFAIGIALYSGIIYVPHDSFLTWVLLLLAVGPLIVACHHVRVWRRLKKLHANIIVD